MLNCRLFFCEGDACGIFFFLRSLYGKRAVEGDSGCALQEVGGIRRSYTAFCHSNDPQCGDHVEPSADPPVRGFFSRPEDPTRGPGKTTAALQF